MVVLRLVVVPREFAYWATVAEHLVLYAHIDVLMKPVKIQFKPLDLDITIQKTAQLLKTPTHSTSKSSLRGNNSRI
jgi:hypothetical protein